MDIVSITEYLRRRRIERTLRRWFGKQLMVVAVCTRSAKWN